MEKVVDTVAILGLGLIGGSLARALKAKGFCEKVIGYGHRTPSLEKGVALGVIDSFTLDLDEVISTADILVICTPTLTAAAMLEDILPRLPERGGPVVTSGQKVPGREARQHIAAASGDGARGTGARYRPAPARVLSPGIKFHPAQRVPS